MTMELIVFGIVIFIIWYIFFYEWPSEIDKIIDDLNADFTNLKLDIPNMEGFIASASMPDTDDIKQFYKRATDFSNNIANAENKIIEMNDQMNQKQFAIAENDANKILEANKKRIDIANLTQTIQQSYVENTATLNKLMDNYKTYINTNTEKLKEMAEKSIPQYLLKNNYVKGIQPVRDGLSEIHGKIIGFLKKNDIIVGPLPLDLLIMKKT